MCSKLTSFSASSWARSGTDQEVPMEQAQIRMKYSSLQHNLPTTQVKEVFSILENHF